MPGAYTLEWRDGRKEDLSGHRGYYYVFPDRTILSFLPDPAWCRYCKQIRLCEHLRDQEALRQELRELADPNFAVRFYDVDCNPLNITEEDKAELWEHVRLNRAF